MIFKIATAADWVEAERAGVFHGSAHDKAIREFTIGKGGMKMGRPFKNVTGILSGAPMHVSPADIERVWSQHDKDVGDRQRRAGDRPPS